MTLYVPASVGIAILKNVQKISLQTNSQQKKFITPRKHFLVKIQQYKHY